MISIVFSLLFFSIERREEGILLRPTFSVPIELYTDERFGEFAEDEEAIGQHLSG
jgi:hypothetical protein